MNNMQKKTKILVKESLGKRPFRGPRRRWKDSIIIDKREWEMVETGSISV
jgi:hypothetical protein